MAREGLPKRIGERLRVRVRSRSAGWGGEGEADGGIGIACLCHRRCPPDLNTPPIGGCEWAAEGLGSQVDAHGVARKL
jgi:hypothetical protein